jgi:heat-inducible transcriptional repressor
MRPENPSEHGVRVIIGAENKDEAVQACSLVISRYGLPGEPLGSIAVVGPTRMEYERTIAVISYVSSVVSLLVTELYGETPKSEKQN